MPRLSSNFRITAKNIFLTYPHCNLTVSEALEQIRAIECPSNKKYIRVRREFHENGEPHLHALVQFQGKVLLHNARHFDLPSSCGAHIFHPNTQGARSRSDIISYIVKGGEFEDWGEFQIDRQSAYAMALNTGNTSSALQVIQEFAPRDFVLHFRRLNSNLDRIFAPPARTLTFNSKWDPNSYKIPDDVERWLGDFFSVIPPAEPGSFIRYKLNRDIHRPISLIIEGPCNTGKTAWARSLGPHNYISGRLDFDPRIYSDEVDYNVIDDVNPSYLKLKNWKMLIGAQHDWQSDCKNGKAVKIKGGIPSIALCKPGEGSSYRDFLDKEENRALSDYTHRNARFVYISDPMY